MNENISMDDDRTWQRETLIAYFDFFLAGGVGSTEYFEVST